MLSAPPAPADARIRYGDEPSHFGDLYLPSGSGPHPLLVVLHGGFWRARYGLDHMSHLASAYARRGIATFNAEYRRVGDRGGGFPGTFEDIATIIDVATRLSAHHPLCATAPGILGFSAGGHLALWAANRARFPDEAPRLPTTPIVAYAVSLAGVSDLDAAFTEELSDNAVVGLLGGAPSVYPERYASSPAARRPDERSEGASGTAEARGLDLVLAHGKLDDCVPYAQTERYVGIAARRGDRPKMLGFESAGHYELIDPRTDAFLAVLDAVVRLALPNATAPSPKPDPRL